MNDSEIFIVGANGQLGRALQKQYPGAQSADINELDITDKQSVDNFDWSNIKIILNAAAYTNVDSAETPEGRVSAWNVNAVAVGNLAAVAMKYDLTLVHVSTEYVFDGTNPLHTEDEPFSPLSVYGSTKAAGDTVVSLVPKHYIFRTTWLIGEGKNFVRTMVGLAEKNISPTVVHDQIGRLTFTAELVGIINHLLTSSAAYGTYNSTNDGEPASWADITREIFHLIGRDDLTVTNTTTQKYYQGKSGIAPRPLQSIMNLDKIKSTGFTPSDWQIELEKYLKTPS